MKALLYFTRLYKLKNNMLLVLLARPRITFLHSGNIRTSGSMKENFICALLSKMAHRTFKFTKIYLHEEVEIG